MALPHGQNQVPPIRESRLAADTGIPDPVLDAAARPDIGGRPPLPRHRDDRRPVAMPLGLGRARQGIDRVLDVIAPPRQDGGQS